MTNRFPWVPVYDDDLGCCCLPQKSGTYLVTTHYEGNEQPRVEVFEFEKETGHWKVDGGFDLDAFGGPVIAWTIAPEPYKEPE